MDTPLFLPIFQTGYRVKSVAILTPWFPNLPGDRAGAFVADSALAVTRAGWQVGVLVVRPWLPRWGRRFSHEMVRGDVCTAAFPLGAVETVRIPALPRSLLRSMTDLASNRIIENALEHIVQLIDADVIHVQTEGSVPIAAQVAHTLRLPVVVTLHGVNVDPRYLVGRYQQRRLRPALAAADRVILVGEPLREFFRSYIGSDKNFHVVPNGIDLPPLGFDRSTFENGPRRLISVANLHEGKGIDLTLRALACLDSEGISNWTYRIIGEGREQAALLKLTTDLGLADKVTFIGLVRHAEIFYHLARDEIFVLPSYREAFGIAYLEAMAAGLLTIGVIGQGPSQFIRNGENGILVPPRDLEALVAALRDILTGDRDRWRQIAHEGQRTVQDAYTWDNHARQLIELYEHVIARNKLEQRTIMSNRAKTVDSEEQCR
jgi:glycosyltransferase involved in cell wall biosynthesis